MADANSGSGVSIARLVLVPSLITLGVTVLRLVGELRGWAPELFNPAPGGGGSLIGIVWLAPIFGIYFALKLLGSGNRPASAGKAVGYAALGLLILVSGIFLAAASQFRSPGKLVASLVLFAVAAATPFLTWPALTKALLAYGYAARLPVVVVMFFAMRGSWGTHYDAPPPDFPAMAFWPKFFMLGILPQLIFWVAFTVIAGSLFGSVTAAIVRHYKAEAPAA